MIMTHSEISGMITSAVSRTAIVCADNELLGFTPSGGQTCDAYMATYISQAGGYLIDPASATTCEYCTLSTTDQFLEGAFGLEYSHAYVLSQLMSLCLADLPVGETLVLAGCISWST
jgi:ABC-type multidrug transport system permease subunit